MIKFLPDNLDQNLVQKSCKLSMICFEMLNSDEFTIAFRITNSAQLSRVHQVGIDRGWLMRNC